MAETWTIQRVLTWTAEHFGKKDVDAPRLTAELLLSKVLGCDRVRLYVEFDRPLNKDELGTYRKLIADRLAGTPTHYLLGYREFYGRRFSVDPRVLIPRPETEQIVEAALALLPAESEGPVLDLCTGSGIIAVSLAAERPQLKVVATDLSEGALEVAKGNAAALGVGERVRFVQGDLFKASGSETFALIASNPPYIATAAIKGLSAEVQKEPHGALDGGADGLVLLRRLIAEAPAHLAPGGSLVLEIGDDQGPAVKALMEAAGLQDARVAKDFAGLDRLATARKP